MKIVQICGNAKSGKSYFTAKLINKLSDLGFESIKLSYSTPLKKILKNLGITKLNLNNKIKYSSFKDFLNCLFKELKNFLNIYSYKKISESDLYTYLNINIKKLKEAYKLYFEEKQNYIGFRLFAQTIGTDIIRKIDKDIFVNILFQKVKDISCLSFINFIIIDDWRFENEDLSRFKSDLNFDIIKVKISSKKAGGEEYYSHISENEFKKFKVDFVVKYDKIDKEIDNILYKIFK